MKIGIIGAMPQEIKILTETMQNSSTWEQAGLVFYAGDITGQEVVVVESGIGKVLASLTASLLIQHYDIDCLINTGSAGGIGRDLAVGDVVISEKLAYHDVDATGFGYAYGQIPGGMPLYYEADGELIAAMKQAAEKNGQAVKTGLIVTGDAFIDDPQKIQAILAHFPDALACEMEGAAIAQTAQQFDVPFLVVRAMSDNGNHEATQSFDEFIDEAGHRSAQMVIDFIKELA